MWMIKPTDFNPKKISSTYLSVFRPGSQEVENRWNNNRDFGTNYWLKRLHNCMC